MSPRPLVSWMRGYLVAWLAERLAAAGFFIAIRFFIAVRLAVTVRFFIAVGLLITIRFFVAVRLTLAAVFSRLEFAAWAVFTTITWFIFTTRCVATVTRFEFAARALFATVAWLIFAARWALSALGADQKKDKRLRLVITILCVDTVVISAIIILVLKPMLGAISD
jgi:hypothetical protein